MVKTSINQYVANISKFELTNIIEYFFKCLLLVRLHDGTKIMCTYYVYTEHYYISAINFNYPYIMYLR